MYSEKTKMCASFGPAPVHCRFCCVWKAIHILCLMYCQLPAIIYFGLLLYMQIEMQTVWCCSVASTSKYLKVLWVVLIPEDIILKKNTSSISGSLSSMWQAASHGCLSWRCSGARASQSKWVLYAHRTSFSSLVLSLFCSFSFVTNQNTPFIENTHT